MTKISKHFKLQNILLLLFILFIFLLTGCKKETTSKSTINVNYNFKEYADNTFKDLVQADALTLNYTLSKPKDYGIENYPTTFGTVPVDTNDDYFTKSEQYLKELSRFRYDKLDKQQQYAYDTMYWYFDNIVKSKDYVLYDEYLSPSTGIQIQLPILLSEYNFYSKDDVDNYLNLLPDIERYFGDICKFEQAKYDAGLFMSKANANKVLKQCKDMMLNISTSLFITEFNNKVEAIDDISQNEIYEFEKKNEDIVLSSILNAYTKVYTVITELNANNNNEGKLCSLPKGKAYYELYMQQITGSNRTVKNVISILENTITSENNALLSFINKNKDTDLSVANKDFGSNDAKEIITTIQNKMSNDFPVIEDISYKIKDVPSQLENSMSPAFYIISPIDDSARNNIYINKGSKYINNPLFTNLAHEAIPGHLYQNCYFNNKNKYPIRSFIKNLGYMEGWASYATLLSYQYSDLDKYYSTLYKYNNALVLCLSARVDIGIHYENWSKKDIDNYFSKNNCPLGKDAINSLYEIIIEEPGDYLPYAVGYIEISRMLDEVKEKQGEDFNLKEFHKNILDAGPAPFTSIKSHLKY